MSYIDGNRPAPFGAITIFRTAEAVGQAAALLRGMVARRATALTEFSPAELEDIGLSVADMPAERRTGPVARLVDAVRAWDARRRTVAELSRLSDAQLEDIGLTRAQIEDLRIG